MKKNVWKMQKVVSIFAKKIGIGQWSFIGPGPEKKWYSLEEKSPQGIWEHIEEKMVLEIAKSSCPIFRATAPLSRGKLKSKGHGKLSIYNCADQATIETIFRIIVFANQLSLYGAVANMCEEYESLHDQYPRTWIRSNAVFYLPGQLDVVMGQLSSVKSKQKFLWRMTTQHIIIFYCNDMNNELKVFHKPTE